jgi:hypothetical protein
MRHQWSEPIIISLIQHQLNYMTYTETGFSAFELEFGTLDSVDYKILPEDNIQEKSPVILKKLNENLKIIRDISDDWQLALVKRRDNCKDTLNKYQPGDFVLFLYDEQNNRDNKLDVLYLGPYIVISHIRNEVNVRNLITDAVSTYHSSRVKPFIGTYEEAKEAAL